MTVPSSTPRWRRVLQTIEGPRPPRPFPVRGWIVIIAGAVGLFWLSVSGLVGFYRMPLALAFGLASLQCVTLPLAPRFPRSAMLLHVVAIVLVGASTHGDLGDEFWPVPIPNLLALIVILVVLGLRETWAVTVSAWWLSFLGMTVVVLLYGSSPAAYEEWRTDVLISVTLTLIAVAASVSIGQRRRVRQIMADARRDVELEQARRAAVEERARIARELHDVVAHSMSIVHIQAESARYRVGDLDDARAEFSDIARSARNALAEMRRLLKALHPEESATFYAPQPTIADIPELIAGAEKVGTPIAFSGDIETGALSPVVQLTAYRIVQEALSNAIRHAPHATVRVDLREHAGVLDVHVENDPPPDGAPRTQRAADAGGHGLRGMRERVMLLHGDILQGPRPDGGFVVAARLPTTSKKEIA